MELEDAIKLWKELGIEQVDFNFYCGGDSMGETELCLQNENGENIESEELKEFFDDAVYNNVEFYVNSDGHYQGESGNVIITLNDEEDDFYYSKNAQSEWSESHDSIVNFELPQNMIDFIKENVSNINGGNDGGCVINFKKDLILSDKDEELISEIEETITELTSSFSPPDLSEDVDEWYIFTTNGEDDSELIINDNELRVTITNNYTVFRDSED